MADIFFPVKFLDKKKRHIVIPKNWTTLTESMPIPDGSLRCLLLKDTDVIIDVDPRNGGFSSLHAFTIATNYDFTNHAVVIHTASKPDRGFHFYFKKDANIAIMRVLKDYPGIEFLTIGDFAAQPGSYHEPTQLHYEYFRGDGHTEIPPLPKSLLEYIIKKPKISNCQSIKDEKPTVLTYSQLKKCLKAIPAEEFRDYNRWLKLLFAVHYACSGSEKGKLLFIEWSRSDSYFKLEAQDAVNAKWETVHNENLQNVTANSVLYFANQYGIDMNDLLMEEELKVQKSAKNDLTFVNSYQELLGDWVYVSDIERYIHRRWGIQDTAKAFSARMRHLMKNAADLVLHEQDCMIERAHGLTYIPREKIFQFDKEGRRLMNMWRPSLLEPKKGNIVPFLEHCNYIFKDNQEYIHIFLSFLAANVQRSTERIRWALVIQSDKEQIGKSSVFGALMRHILGHHNVTCPSVIALQSEFNGFLANKQLCLIEELTAFHKTQTMAKLRSLITDDIVIINEKFMKPYSLPNTISFLMFTNLRDSLSITLDDKRYCTLTTDVKRKEDDYYIKLHAWLSRQNGWAKILYYLERYAFDKKLLFGGNAPMTKGKEMMVQHASPIEVDTVEDVISNEKLDVMGYVNYAFVRQYLTLNVSDYRLSRALEYLGYRNRFRLRSPLDSQRYRIYGKHSTPPPQDILNKLCRSKTAATA